MRYIIFLNINSYNLYKTILLYNIATKNKII